MPSLRRCLRRPELYLSLIAAAGMLVVADTSRSPARQVSAQWYVGAVRVYQHYGRPLTSTIVQCRYAPTCSEYSAEAVGRYGLRRGLTMTLRRVLSCRGNVPAGTPDPVP